MVKMLAFRRIGPLAVGAIWILGLADAGRDPAFAQSGYTRQLTSLGLPPSLRLSGTLAEQTVSIPVHPGQFPASLTGELRTVPGLSSGHLTIENEGRTLATLALPPKEARMAISLARATVKQERLTLTFRAVLNVGEARCAAPHVQWIDLTDMSITFRGTARAPTAVADFWPPDLGVLHLYVSPTPNMAEATAVVTLAAFAARLGAGHAVTVTVTALDPNASWPDAPAEPFTRSVVVRSAAPGEARLIWPPHKRPGQSWPSLLVTAPPAELEAFTEALVGKARPLLLAARGTLTASPDSEVKIGDQWTLAALGHPQTQMQGAGQVESNVRFSQADLGGPLADVALRLAGTHSPVPPGATAHLGVFLNGGLVQATLLERNGRFDLYTPLPNALLRRDNTLTVRVSYTPPGGDCRVGGDNMIVRLDGESYLQVQRGQKLPAGFERFPQVLLPDFYVSFNRVTPEALQAGAQIVAALQRLTRTPLHPKAVSWSEALIAKKPWVAVAPERVSTGEMNPPLEATPFRLLDSDGHELLRLDLEARFAVMEAFTAQGRDVLLLAHRGWPKGLTSLTHGLATETGWYGLSGDAWLAPSDRPPFGMRLRDSGLKVEPLSPSPWVWWERLRIFAYLLAFAAVVAFLFWVYPKVVRTRPARQPHS